MNELFPNTTFPHRHMMFFQLRYKVIGCLMTLYQCLNDVVFAKYIIITFSIVNYPYPCHSCMFITENCSSKFLIMSFWAPAPKSPSNNGIPKKSLDMSLRIFFHFGSFFALPPTPPNNPKNQNFEKIKKAPGHVIILHMPNINDNHMMYGS